ncbi:hypothetical protein G7Y79_00051g086680 [Physcia stellaris]|nr:hypothetical protein G7Y79_00051g086680 [Physcia stellaris]
MLLGKHAVLLALTFLSLKLAGATPTGLTARELEVSNRLHKDSLPHNPSLRIHRNASHPVPSLSLPHPVECFRIPDTRLLRPEAEDCRLIINHIILGYPSPMSEITFGYTDAADFDLRAPANQKWIHGSCVIFLRSTNRHKIGRFRIIDIAIASERVVSQCIDGRKVNMEGVVDVGSEEDLFFVGVGGGAGNRGPRGGGMGVKGI